ncbi:MAG: adenylate kinase [Herpetosiphon sp.]
MNVILVGPPGAGKGTQAKYIQKRMGLLHIASGDLLRKAMSDETALGLEARAYVDRGELVPDKLVISMILERIFEPDCARGVIFDGFPRTKDQAIALADMLREHNRKIDAVVFLNVPRDILLKRIAGRQTCRTCQKVYNLYYFPPRDEDLCDDCGGELYQRSDDNMATARHRLDVYFQQTMPLIEHYRAQGLLHEIDGNTYVEYVTDRLTAELGTP